MRSPGIPAAASEGVMAAGLELTRCGGYREDISSQGHEGSCLGDGDRQRLTERSG